ncbi:MAG: DUF4282 domain-containing protein [Alphaproteobacteria bacterium]|nr:DUF4282 domain-containing protein [Alphaproteobacteria bacterium]
MAARDILTLNTPMAERIIRLLYTIALVLIAIGTLFGIGRGVMILTHTPMQRPAITSNANPSGNNAVTPQSGTAAPQTDAQNDRRDFRNRMRGEYRGWYGRRHYGPFGTMPRSPIFGLVVIIGALLRGLIGLLIVRVLAEIGLAILGMPKRAAT